MSPDSRRSSLVCSGLCHAIDVFLRGVSGPQAAGGFRRAGCLSSLRFPVLFAVSLLLMCPVAVASQDIERNRQLAELQLQLSEVERVEQLLRYEAAFHEHRTVRGVQAEGDLATQLAAIAVEREQLINQLVELTSMQDYLSMQTGDVKRARDELRAYTEQLRLLQKQNEIKTLLTLGLATAQEVAAFATTGGKAVELVTWAADKLAGEGMKQALTGGDEYYTRQLTRISNASQAVIPELQELGKISGQTVEFWQSYLHVREGKDLKGSTATILAKGRVLLDLAARAEARLSALADTIEEAIRANAAEIDRRKGRIAELELLARSLHEGESGIKSDIDAARDEYERLKAEIARYESERESIKQRIAELEGTPAAASPASTPGIDAAVSRFRGQLNSWSTESAEYAAQGAAAVKAREKHTQLMEALEALGTQQKSERDALLKSYQDRPHYPYGNIPDRDKLANYESYHRDWLDLDKRHIEQRSELFESMGEALEDLLSHAIKPPYDPRSEILVWHNLGSAHASASGLIQNELRRLNQDLRSASRAEERQRLQAEITRLDNLKKAIDAEMSGAARPFTALHRNLPEALADYHRVELRRLNSYLGGLSQNRQEHDSSRAGLPERVRQIARELDDRRKGYLQAADQYLDRAGVFLSEMEDYIARRDVFFRRLRSLASEGVLKETAGGGSLPAQFTVNRDWVRAQLSGVPNHCASIDLLIERLQPVSVELNPLAAAVHAASGVVARGVGQPPLSDWSALNEPAVHQRVAAMGARVDDARRRLQAQGQFPPSEPVTSFLNSLLGIALMSDLSDIFRGISESSRLLKSILDMELNRSERMLKEARIDIAERDALPRQLAMLRGRYETELSCLPDDFPGMSDLLDGFQVLERRIRALSDKPTYASGAGLIASLEAFHLVISREGFGADEEYRRRVVSLSSEFETLRSAVPPQGTYTQGDTRSIQSLLEQIERLLTPHRNHAESIRPVVPVSNEQIQRLYQDFINAYGTGNLRGLMQLLAPDWQGGDGADLRDVEEVLTNSFRVFDRIQYRISAFSATPLSDGRVRVSYNVRIVGENRRQRLTHEEQSQVVEEIGLVDGQPRILRTLSGTQWLR